MADWLFPYLPDADILKAYAKAPGNEMESGKLSSPESSAALAANMFGYFLNQPRAFPAMPKFGAVGWPARRVALEECLRFPWRGGRHPWLDAVIETDTHLIGVESKRYEPFRQRSEAKFSQAYWRSVWGKDMVPFEEMRDRLSAGSLTYERLDATQLVKHAFGLRTQGLKRKKLPLLVYLYGEPRDWPDGRAIEEKLRQAHRDEIRGFAHEVAGAEVPFASCTYHELLTVLSNSPERGGGGARGQSDRSFQALERDGRFRAI
jgi:hypothetical protein